MPAVRESLKPPVYIQVEMILDLTTKHSGIMPPHWYDCNPTGRMTLMHFIIIV